MEQNTKSVTLEDAADLYCIFGHAVGPKDQITESFKAGAQWQKEEDKELFLALRELYSWHKAHDSISFIEEDLLNRVERLIKKYNS